MSPGPAPIEAAPRDDEVESSSSADGLRSWLEARTDVFPDAWLSEILRREDGRGTDHRATLDLFVRRLTALLPRLLGPLRDDLVPLWDRAFELFGVVAAKRGLAAGEAIEEVHIFRELLIRELYREPPVGARLSLRHVLRLNRALDRAVTHASIGHTDALFFEFFESDAHRGHSDPREAIEEACAQLEALQREVDVVLAHAVAPSLSDAEH